MRHRDSKLQQANVVAGFDSQEEAEDALLELRNMGFRDRRIGFYYQAGNDRMTDLLAGHHRFAATALWGVIGAVVGAGIVFLLSRLGSAGPDPIGLAVTLGACGALFLGTAGGMMGLWTERPGEEVAAPVGPEVPFVMAVAAGNSAGQVWEALRRRGGHELRAGSHPVVLPGQLLA